MKSKLAILAGGALAASLVAGCGGGSNGGTMTPPPTPPPSSNLALDTAEVLALAQQPSETQSPLPVDEGAVTLTDTSETSAPIAVAAM
jgi:hypothetical protein